MLDKLSKTGTGGWLANLAVLPSVVLSLLPSATCLFCIAAYAGALSAVGLGFLVNEKVLVPLIVVFLVVNVAGVAWSTRSHQHLTPLISTSIGATFVIAGRLMWNIPTLLYIGVVLLISGSLWNLWLKRPKPATLTQLGRNRNNQPLTISK